MTHDPCVVTFFTGYGAASKNEMLLDLDDLVSRIRLSTGPDKAGLPWLKLARFGALRTAKGSLRWDGNMLAISGIEADYDDEQISVDQVVEILGTAGVLCIIYTSPSHTEDSPRWRVLCPLSLEYAPAERDRFLARLNGLLGGVIANESWTRSQSYYFGSVSNNPSHRVELLDGAPIDLMDELDVIAIGKPEKPKTNGAAHHGPATPPEAITDKRINGLIESLLDNIRHAVDGSKYFTLRDISFTIGGYLHLTTWSEAEAVEACVAALPGAEDWEHARKTAAQAIAAGKDKPLNLADRPGYIPSWAREKPADKTPPGAPPGPGGGPDIGEVEGEAPEGPDWPEPPPPEGPPGGPRPDEPPELPVIICAAGELTRMVRETEAALLNSGLPIYVRGSLVQPTEQEYRDADGNVTHSAGLANLIAPSIALLMDRSARFMKWDGRAHRFVGCDPPEKLIQLVLYDRVGWPFPVVRGVLTCPTIRPDGSILRAPGYDPASRYYLMFPSDLVVPEIPDAPNKADARKSLDRLDGLLDSYPFVSAASRSVALTMLMTQVLRSAMANSPLLAVSAKAPGTGKSHLVNLCSALAIGRSCPAMGAGKDDKETEKEINTMLLSGVPGFSIDNVSSDIDLPLLNRATSETHLTIRIFGKLESVEVENYVVIYMTGNNLAIVDEQGRRSMRCDLDAQVARPERRHFDADPIKLARADRGRYIADILTIARAYHLSGEKVAPFPLSGFDSWSHFVREPLIWLGRADPADTMETTTSDDPASIRLRAMVAGWHKEFGNTSTTVADAIAKSDPDGFYQTLREQFGIRGGSGIDSSRIGYWLRKYAGRVVEGKRFVKDEGHTGGTIRWYVEVVEPFV